jgi:hypothetical protein
MAASRSTGADRPARTQSRKEAVEPADRRRGLRNRLGWFVLLYLASAVAYAAAVYGLRMLVPHP